MLYEDLKKDGYLENKTFYNRGTTANIYLFKDNLVKIYYNSTLESQKIRKKIFFVLKSINSKNFVSLKDPIYRGEESIFSPDGYTMKEVKGGKIVPLYADSEYLLEMIKMLDNLSDILTNERISIFDTNPGNIIFTENNVVVIDPDMYSKSILPKNILKRNNKIAVMKYVNNTLIRDIYEYEHKDLLFDPLNMDMIKSYTNLADLYSKKLVKKKVNDSIKNIHY